MEHTMFHSCLIVEWEPGDVDLAGRLENARRDVGAAAGVGDEHVRGVGAVEGLVRAVVHEDVRLPQLVRRDPDVLDPAVLGLVPLHVHVRPLLQGGDIIRSLMNSLT